MSQSNIPSRQTTGTYENKKESPNLVAIHADSEENKKIIIYWIVFFILIVIFYASTLAIPPAVIRKSADIMKVQFF